MVATPVTATITSSNLFDQPYWNIYNLLNDRSKVKDPHPSNNLKRKFFYGSMPSLESLDYNGYPIVVLEYPDMPSPSKTNLTGTKEKVFWEINGQIRAADNDPALVGPEETPDRVHNSALTYIRSIMNDILETIKDSANQNTLRSCGTFNHLVRVTDNDQVFVENQKVFVTGFSISFDCQLKVSA